MLKRITAIILLLTMCLSLLPFGTVAYAEEATSESQTAHSTETSTEPATSGDVKDPIENEAHFGRVGNYTFFSDDTLETIFGLESKAQLWDFLRDMHITFSNLDNIVKSTEEKVEEGEEYYIEWKNYDDETKEYKYPLVYNRDEKSASGGRSDQDDRNSALTYMLSNHPLFSEDMRGYKIEESDDHFIKSIKFYCSDDYTKEQRIAIRTAFVDATEPVIRLFKSMKDNGRLTDEQIVLLVCDYYTSCSLYDMAISGVLEAYGTVVTRKSVCQGQATAMNYIFDNIGIPCKMASNVKMGHGWNVVSLNGQEYNICLTSAGTKMQGKIVHDYTMISTRDFLIRRVGGKPVIAASDKKIDYVVGRYMENTVGGPSKRTGAVQTDTATDTSYESAFWKDVDTAFVLYDDDLIFISRDGTLCRWKGNEAVQVKNANENSKYTTTEQVWEVLTYDDPENNRYEPNHVLPGIWDQDGDEKYYSLLTDYELDYQIPDGDTFVPYKGKYYFSSNDAIYELFFDSKDNDDLTYCYKKIFDAKEKKILRDGEKIYDLIVRPDEYFFKIGTRYETFERDGRYGHYYYKEENTPEVKIDHSMVAGTQIQHVFTVKKADVSNYVKDLDSIELEYVTPYNNPLSKSDSVQEYTRIMGEYIGKGEKTSDDENYYFTVTEPMDAYYHKEHARKYASCPITVYLTMTDENNKVTRTQFQEFNGSKIDEATGKILSKYEIKEQMDFTVCFDTEGFASVNYKIPAEQIDRLVSAVEAPHINALKRTYIRCEIPQREETGSTGIKYVNVDGEKGSDGNYCYRLRDFGGAQMDSEIRATLFIVTEDGAEYYYNDVDTHIIYFEENIDETKIRPGHTLSVEEDLSIHYMINTSLVPPYVNSFIICEIPMFAGNERICSRYEVLQAERAGPYFKYSLEDLTALQMGDEIVATLYRVKEDGTIYRHTFTDTYSIYTYANNQLNKSVSQSKLKKLCAELLRYGTKAQIFKERSTDALVDRNLTEEQKALLTPLNEIAFYDRKSDTGILADPDAIWVGRSLILDSKIAMRFIFTVPENFKEDPRNLFTLHVSYVNSKGETVEKTVPYCTFYNESKKQYVFDFGELRAAEWREKVTVAIYCGATRISSIRTYSVDSYGIGKTGDLLALCQAMLSFSDSAKAYFAE